MMQPFVKPNFPSWASNNIEASRFDGFIDFETTELSTRSTKSASRKNAKANLCNLNAKSWFFRTMSLDFDDSSL